MIGQIENTKNPAIGKRTYTVIEIMDFLSISRKKAYEICNSGVFKIVRVGRSIRISKSSFDEWLDNQSYYMEE
jgi:excisionase family DNA binding protein